MSALAAELGDDEVIGNCGDGPNDGGLCIAYDSKHKGCEDCVLRPDDSNMQKSDNAVEGFEPQQLDSTKKLVVYKSAGFVMTAFVIEADGKTESGVCLLCKRLLSGDDKFIRWQNQPLEIICDKCCEKENYPIHKDKTNVAAAQQLSPEPQLPIGDDENSDDIDEPIPPPEQVKPKAKKKRKAKKPKRTPEQKQADGNMWEAVKHVWRVDDNASWKIARLQQFFLGTIKKTGRYKAFFDTQLDEQPADGCEVVAFGHWYRSEYDDIPLPENGDKLRSHFETFRGSGERWQTFMRKANKTILEKIPKYTSPGIELEREQLQPVVEGEQELISEEQQQEALKIMDDLANKFGGRK
ncbi:MAG TPA: hypothetical protein ENI05_03200 [Porticoccus sp.]|nr:hypothetical protein [Porticoccus sp.]